LLWHAYCNAETVSIGTLLAAIHQFLEEYLHLTAEEVAACLIDKPALANALDRSKSGRVCDCCRVLLLNVVPHSFACLLSHPRHPLTHTFIPSVDDVALRVCACRLAPPPLPPCPPAPLPPCPPAPLPPHPPHTHPSIYQVCVTEIIPVLGTPDVPFLDLLAAAVASGRVPPFTVPPPPCPYFGYSHHLGVLVSSATQDPRGVRVVSGPPGSGVSSFLLAAAHALKHPESPDAPAPGPFPGGIHFVSLSDATVDPGREDGVAAAVCVQVGIPTRDAPGPALRAWCRSRGLPTLLVVDLGLRARGDEHAWRGALFPYAAIPAAAAGRPLVAVVVGVGIVQVRHTHTHTHPSLTVTTLTPHALTCTTDHPAPLPLPSPSLSLIPRVGP
jgi:hypothetical protein